MSLIERAKNILLTPRTEWQKIAAEPASVGGLYGSYIIPLAAIGPICTFIGITLVGVSVPFVGTYRFPLMAGLTSAILSYVFGLIGVFVVALITDFLAPTFGGQKNQVQALKVAAYAYTPAWIAGALHLLPMLGVLVLLASLYGLYLLYLGLPVLMKSPVDKAVGYTAVVVICAIIVAVVLGVITAAIGIGRPPMPTGSPLSMRGTGPGSPDANPALQALQQMGDQMQAANKKMEAAKASGDQQAQAAAAAEAMSALLGGGAPADPVDAAVLKAMLPDSAGTFRRTGVESEKSGMGGMMMSKAQATYGDDQGRSLQLVITDMGGMKGLGAVASWANVEQDKQTDFGYERIGKVDGRPVHETFNKNGPRSEYSVLVASRFLIDASGNQEMNAVRQLAAGVDLGKLEAMKGVGVKQQ
jgi:hypothetical protein